MRYSVLLSVLASLSKMISADCSQSGGNYYCNEVSAVVYNGIGYSGSYKDVTSMDESGCSCEQSSTTFSGTLSPLDEELSVHFRGPLNLKQFGVYYPSSGSNSKKAKRDVVKREEEEECTTTRHVHHQHKRAVKVVEVTDTVFVDQNGNLITKTGTSTTTTQGSNDVTATTASQDFTSTYSSAAVTSATTSSSSSSAAASSSSSSSSSSGDWERVAYFEPGSISNITFLNSLGGVNGSGTWSSCFGNSLSYCGSDGSSASSSSVALDDVTIESDTEYMIFSGSSCDDTSVGDCGYYRENIPLYHGFGGVSKIFVFEFEMPTETKASSSSENYDMPAIWLLNAKIPRTLQYGDSSCSCWSTGCGEMDLFEILTSGESRLISHLHTGQGDNGSAQGGGGSQDYFKRPTSSSVKAAAIFDNGEVHVVILDDSTDFGSSLSSSDVSSWESITGGTANLS